MLRLLKFLGVVVALVHQKQVLEPVLIEVQMCQN